MDRDAGHLRPRSFAPELGVGEDEDTGAAATRISEYLIRVLTITQGRGSLIHTRWSPNGWVGIGGCVIQASRGHTTGYGPLPQGAQPVLSAHQPGGGLGLFTCSRDADVSELRCDL